MSDLRLYLADMASPRAGLDRVDVGRANDRFRRDVLASCSRPRAAAVARHPRHAASSPWPSTGWTNNRNVTQMLELLAMRGEVAVAGRRGRQRLWDLAERVYPPDLPVVPARRGPPASATPGACARSASPARSGTAAPVERSDVGDAGEPAEVEGVAGTWRVDPGSLGAPVHRPHGAAVAVRPADPRPRPRRPTLFGFEYILEMYKPAASAAGATSRCRSSTTTGWSGSSTPRPTARPACSS